MVGRLAAAFVTASVLTVGIAASLAAHEEGVIRLSSPSASPGQEIEIRGERLPRSTMLRLELRGALATRALGEIRSDARGAFVMRLALPAVVDPGRYRVVALAPDDDVVARADLVVVAEPLPEIVRPGPTRTAQATDAMMELPLRRTAGEWAAIVALVALAALGGAVLLRGRGARGDHRPPIAP